MSVGTKYQRLLSILNSLEVHHYYAFLDTKISRKKREKKENITYISTWGTSIDEH